MTNTVNWTGNRVLDPGGTRQPSRAFSATTPTMQSNSTLPVQEQTPITQQGPPPSTEKGFIPYYLASNIGKNVRAEFIVGTNQYVDKTGMLTEVGINYFVLRDVNSRTDIMCDLYSVKFVTILQS